LLATGSTTNTGNLYIICPDSGMSHIITPDLGALGSLTYSTAAAEFAVTGCLPLITQPRQTLLIAKGQDNNAQTLGRLLITVANFSLPSFISTGASRVI
jgi:hypothetical protein